ncbi:MAG: DUF2256 domain-containing protein [Verrucomicrobia bacterium]|nr:DUF2256 domain-containing protein [Verrucomicrobiota bacterium]
MALSRGVGKSRREMRVKKADLPSTMCAACHRAFVWRKKWARDWERVKYCSDACRRGVHPLAESSGAGFAGS